MRHMCPLKCLLMFYNAYAKSILDYAMLSYGAANKTSLSKIDMAQRRILKSFFSKER